MKEQMKRDKQDVVGANKKYVTKAELEAAKLKRLRDEEDQERQEKVCTEHAGQGSCILHRPSPCRRRGSAELPCMHGSWSGRHASTLHGVELKRLHGEEGSGAAGEVIQGMHGVVGGGRGMRCASPPSSAEGGVWPGIHAMRAPLPC